MKEVYLKKGLIYKAPLDNTWQHSSAITPTPLLLKNGVLRIFCGFRDIEGKSRIGYVDLDREDPTKITSISKKPVLDLGNKGCFDDAGMILGDIFYDRNKIRMYYVGFQIVENVKFLAFSGLAESIDEGESFIRVKETPILDRFNDGRFIAAIHSVIKTDNGYKLWFAAGNEWKMINSKPFPCYEIYYAESNDGVNINIENTSSIIKCNKKNGEYRIGKPTVYFDKSSEKYTMYFTYGTIDGQYKAGMAFSEDGINWERIDELFPLKLGENGEWDSLHLSYPRILKYNGKQYMFYNGNFMGEDGFGLAFKR